MLYRCVHVSERKFELQPWPLDLGTLDGIISVRSKKM